MENYDYSSMDSGFWAIFGLVGISISLITAVLSLAGGWKIFEKAGKPGWAVLIPIYNTIVVAEIVGKPLWWGLLPWVPCGVNVVFSIWLLNLLMKSFGKDVIYTILAIFLPFIIFPLIGFGSDVYLGPSAAEAAGTSFNQFKQPPSNPFNQDEPTDPTA